MKMSKVLWTKEQLAAIETENSNIIVSAGAGSGKTAVLTTRIINKLKNGISANQLLVLTFTNAAAAEMKNRIIDKMKEDNALKSKISEVENAYITTFDSFAYSMVKKYHYLFNLSKNIHILDSSIFYLVEKQFLSEIFLSLYESKDSSFLNMIDRFTIKDDAEIIQSILNIYKKFDQIIDKQTYLSNYLSCFFSDEMLAQYKKDFFELIFSKLNEASLIFEEVLLPLIKKQDEINAYYQLFDSKYYDLLVDSLLSIKTLRIITEDEEIKKEKKHFDSIIKEIKDLCIYANEKEIDFALNDAIQYEKVILNILQTLDSKVISYKRKYEAFEFNDIAKMALDIVKNHPDIQENLKNANIIEVSSTALSAKEVSQRKFAACICNLDCLSEYNLNLLQANIQDNNSNETKFWKLSKSNIFPENANTMSMLFSTKHTPGALYNALSIFNKYNLNLTKIESRPAKTKLGEYYFLVDIEINKTSYSHALEELKETVGFYRILGIYHKGE